MLRLQQSRILMNYKFSINGFLTLKEDTPSPISSVFMKHMINTSALENDWKMKEQLQCIVSNDLIVNSIPLDKHPKL
jgi:hypothetical protein